MFVKAAKGTARLSKNRTTTALIISSMLATGCWTDEATQGYLAVAFEDGELLTRPILIPPAEDGEYRLYFALEARDKICVLRGQIPEEGLFFYPRCESLKGTGMLSCNNGHSLNLQWRMTSCQGGRGRSIEFSEPTFHFGFASTESGALTELEKAQLETRALSHVKRSQGRAQPAPGSTP